MDVPKRILYIVTKANWGGAQRYVFDLATAAKATGHSVVVAYGQEGALAERLKKAGVEGRLLGNLGRDVSTRDAGAYRDIYRLINELGPDVVHLNSSKAGILGALAARVLGIKKILFTAHGWAFNEDRPFWQRWIFWWAHYITVLLSHHTIAVSRAILRGARTMPFVQRKLVLVQLGIAEPEFLNREEARAALPLQFGDGLYIGGLAELTWNKSLHTLVRALYELKQHGMVLHAVVLGEGEERNFLETLADELGLAEQIHLVGFIPDGWRYLKAFDLFALPSRTEALAYALIEAGFAGLPTVASDVGGVPEVIESGVSGLLVERENQHALADALQRLAENPDLRIKFAETLQKSVREKFSLERMVKETLKLY